MKFIELARKRCSIRSFKPDPVPEESLLAVLEAGRLAPTAKNLQPFRFIAVRDPDLLKQLCDAYPAKFLREAPLIIVVCVCPEEGWTRDRHDGKNYAEVDAAIAVDHMTLAATEAGLGTCWIGAFDPVKVGAVMQLPNNVYPLVMLPVGYPAAEGREKVRKSLDELVSYERW